MDLSRHHLVTRLEIVNNAVSLECLEIIIPIVSISIRLVVIHRMPPSKKSKLKCGTFVTEFSNYLDKLLCIRGKLIIAGDLIVWKIMTVSEGIISYTGNIRVGSTHEFSDISK